MSQLSRSGVLASATRKLVKVGALAGVLTLGLTACSSGGSSESSSGEEQSFGSISVQYSWIKNEEFAGEAYAYDKGYYDEAGFDEVTGIAGPDTGVTKLLAGTVQVALSDAASVGAAIAEQDAPLKIIGATFQKNPFTIVSLTDGADIQSPEDMIGKTIGVQDSNTSVFKALLAANGISEDQVDIQSVGYDPTVLIDGTVDGWVGYTTNEVLTVENMGYDVSSMTYADNGLPYVAETYAVTDEYLAANQDLLKAFLIAEIKGWTHVFQEDTDTTVEVVTNFYNEATTGDASAEALDPTKTAQAVEAEKDLISTADTEENGLFTISDELQEQTVASLAAAGWDVTVDELFDTTIIDEIYSENPDLKSYLP